MLILSLLIYINKRHRKYTTFFIIFTSGFIWSFLYSYHQLAWTLPKEEEGKTLPIIGYIASIPAVDQHQTSFLFSLTKLNNQPQHTLIKLNWRDAPNNINVGDQWRFTVRLKRIHGLMNPGGFNYETWAFSEGIRANGYILSNPENKIINQHGYQYPINRLRQNLKEKIEKNLPVTLTSPWIVALAVGERQGIAQPQWQILRNTGTNHLMAIAGLHIGIISGFIFALVNYLWRQFPRLTLKLPSVHAGAIASLLMAGTYSALSGFSIPSQRACIMLTTYLIITLLRRKNNAWQSWSIAFFVVLIINPLSALSDSFCLSFGSIALIIYGVSARLNPRGIWWKWGRVQWVIALGLLPLSVGLFQQFSLIAFIANSIAIPWVGFVIVPLTLLGCFVFLFSNQLAIFFLTLADKNLSVLWKILTYLSNLSWAAWYQYIPNNWIIIFACVGVVILLVPQGAPGRWLGILWILPLIFYKPSMPKAGEAWFTLLDVGQGLSAVVQTQKHLLIFDTGARLSDSFDMGNNVVTPFLRTLAIKDIDMLVISHGDNDHIGGAKAILNSFNVKSIKTSVPDKFPVGRAEFCLKNQNWIWDGVSFQFLYPAPESLELNNDSSCVLKVSAGKNQILLTGDIEKSAEKYLVSYAAEQLKSTVLVAPHHGSKTSAEDSFIEAVNPAYVLFPVGYRNRYHFPNKTVVEKYQHRNTTQYDTVEDGAIQFVIGADQSISALSLYRLMHKKYYF